MQRLKTRPQFQAAMAGGTVSRTPHFALHRLVLGADNGTASNGRAVVVSGSGTPTPAGAATAAVAVVVASDLAAVPIPSVAAPTGPGHLPPALFAHPGVWLGAMVPKRWARRAVTRNTIKRQIYTVGASFEAMLEQVAPDAAHVVRLRSTFDRKQFVSATSDQLKQAVRAELQQLFAHAVKRPGASAPAYEGAGRGSAAAGKAGDKGPSVSRVSAVAP
jgi:ribonuclease P protein component